MSAYLNHEGVCVPLILSACDIADWQHLVKTLHNRLAWLLQTPSTESAVSTVAPFFKKTHQIHMKNSYDYKPAGWHELRSLVSCHGQGCCLDDLSELTSLMNTGVCLTPLIGGMASCHC